MVKIRLTRTGKKHQPHYRLIAIQTRTKRDGKALEELGYYNPRTQPSTIELKNDRIQYWLDNGAQPTDTVKYLLIKQGILKAEANKKVYTKTAGQNSQDRTAKKDEKKAAAKAEKEKPAEQPVKEEAPTEE